MAAPIELNEVVEYAKSLQDCKKAYKKATPNMFCAGVPNGGKGSCQVSDFKLFK